MIARAHRAAERSECRIRLDRDAPPAREIKCERDVVVDRMAGADIDVIAVRDVAEAAPEMEVLETLRVGQGRERHAVIYPVHTNCAACGPHCRCAPHRSAART